jgi:sterol desaturase/sphingolipid hydroxylase (fatty acid hydroxylase superfamily)
MVAQLLGLGVGFALLSAIFAALERWGRTPPRRAPSPPEPASLATAADAVATPTAAVRVPWWRRRDVKTDLAWWITTPFLARALTFVAVVVSVGIALLATGRTFASIQAEYRAGRFPDLGVFGLGPTLRGWPLALQILAGLLVVDLLGYGMHRAFHRRPLWPFHAVHHSSPRLDWLSSIRVHPVNQVLTKVLEGSTLLLLGFDPRVFAVVTPFLTFYALLLHADVGWTFGPLRRVIASPMFHRWHHAADREAWGKNFAGLFACWDVLFGTFHLPVGAVPRALGAPTEPVPGRFLAQLVYPLRRAKPGEPLARDAA